MLSLFCLSTFALHSTVRELSEEVEDLTETVENLSETVESISDAYKSQLEEMESVKDALESQLADFKEDKEVEAAPITEINIQYEQVALDSLVALEVETLEFNALCAGVEEQMTISQYFVSGTTTALNPEPAVLCVPEGGVKAATADNPEPISLTVAAFKSSVLVGSCLLTDDKQGLLTFDTCTATTEPVVDVAAEPIIEVEAVYSDVAVTSLESMGAAYWDFFVLCVDTPTEYTKHIQDKATLTAFPRMTIPVCANEGGVLAIAQDDALPVYQLNVDVYSGGEIKLVGHCELTQDATGITINTCNPIAQ